MRTTFLAILALGCSASPALSPRDCTPGVSVACACPGASGVQVCGDDGELAPCVCSDAGAPVEDAPPLPSDAPAAPSDAPDVRRAVGADVPPLMGDVVSPSRDVVAVDTARACDPRQTCGSVCVEDYATDPRNCGGCFIACPAGGAGTVPTCRGGRCDTGCLPGLVPCGVGVCVDPASSAFDCAACGFSCPSSQRCDYDGRRGRCVAR